MLGYKYGGSAFYDYNGLFAAIAATKLSQFQTSTNWRIIDRVVLPALCRFAFPALHCLPVLYVNWCSNMNARRSLTTFFYLLVLPKACLPLGQMGVPGSHWLCVCVWCVVFCFYIICANASYCLNFQVLSGKTLCRRARIMQVGKNGHGIWRLPPLKSHYCKGFLFYSIKKLYKIVYFL